MNHAAIAFGISGLGALLLACAPVSMPEADEGAAFFAANCTECHGRTGQGNGPLASGLTPPPTDLTMLARGNGGAFPTARALSYIYGQADGGHLARVMPEFGATIPDDMVPLEVDGVLTPTPRALVGLFEYLTAIQR